MCRRVHNTNVVQPPWNKVATFCRWRDRFTQKCLAVCDCTGIVRNAWCNLDKVEQNVSKGIPWCFLAPRSHFCNISRILSCFSFESQIILRLPSNVILRMSFTLAYAASPFLSFLDEIESSLLFAISSGKTLCIPIIVAKEMWKCLELQCCSWWG